jgi:hypothetical protein
MFLNNKQRQRAAGLLVFLYTFCAIGPATAIGLGDGAAAAHCLTSNQYGIGRVHVHQDEPSHHHSGGGPNQHSEIGKCCGLFSASALAPDLAVVVNQPVPASHQPLLIANSLTGRAADRIDRPPRFLLSL